MNVEQFQETFSTWFDVVTKRFQDSFSEDYDINILAFLHENIDREIKHVFSSSDRYCTAKRTQVLFNVLTYLYEHILWKLRKEDFPNATLSCVKLLSQLIKTGLLLTQGLAECEYIDRILTALKLFTGKQVLLFDALLLVNGLKRLHHKPYSAILRCALKTDYKEITDPLLYMEIILLFRRLKALSDSSNKTLYSLATKIKPPSNLISWLVSLDVNGSISFLKLLKHKKIFQQLMKKNIPESLLKTIRNMILKSYYFEESCTTYGVMTVSERPSDLFITDTSSLLMPEVEPVKSNKLNLKKVSSKKQGKKSMNKQRKDSISSKKLLSEKTKKSTPIESDSHVLYINNYSNLVIENEQLESLHESDARETYLTSNLVAKTSKDVSANAEEHKKSSKKRRKSKHILNSPIHIEAVQKNQEVKIINLSDSDLLDNVNCVPAKKSKKDDTYDQNSCTRLSPKRSYNGGSENSTESDISNVKCRKKIKYEIENCSISPRSNLGNVCIASENETEKLSKNNWDKSLEDEEVSFVAEVIRKKTGDQLDRFKIDKQKSINYSETLSEETTSKKMENIVECKDNSALVANKNKSCDLKASLLENKISLAQISSPLKFSNDTKNSKMSFNQNYPELIEGPENEEAVSKLSRKDTLENPSKHCSNALMYASCDNDECNNMTADREQSSLDSLNQKEEVASHFSSPSSDTYCSSQVVETVEKEAGCNSQLSTENVSSIKPIESVSDSNKEVYVKETNKKAILPSTIDLVQSVELKTSKYEMAQNDCAMGKSDLLHSENDRPDEKSLEFSFECNKPINISNSVEKSVENSFTEDLEAESRLARISDKESKPSTIDLDVQSVELKTSKYEMVQKDCATGKSNLLHSENDRPDEESSKFDVECNKPTNISNSLESDENSFIEDLETESRLAQISDKESKISPNSSNSDKMHKEVSSSSLICTVPEDTVLQPLLEKENELSMDNSAEVTDFDKKVTFQSDVHYDKSICADANERNIKQSLQKYSDEVIENINVPSSFNLSGCDSDVMPSMEVEKSNHDLSKDNSVHKSMSKVSVKSNLETENIKVFANEANTFSCSNSDPVFLGASNDKSLEDNSTLNTAPNINESKSINGSTEITYQGSIDSECEGNENISCVEGTVKKNPVGECKSESKDCRVSKVEDSSSVCSANDKSMEEKYLHTGGTSVSLDMLQETKEDTVQGISFEKNVSSPSNTLSLNSNCKDLANLSDGSINETVECESVKSRILVKEPLKISSENFDSNCASKSSVESVSTTNCLSAVKNSETISQYGDKVPTSQNVLDCGIITAKICIESSEKGNSETAGTPKDSSESLELLDSTNKDLNNLSIKINEKNVEIDMKCKVSEMDIRESLQTSSVRNLDSGVKFSEISIKCSEDDKGMGKKIPAESTTVYFDNLASNSSSKKDVKAFEKVTSNSKTSFPEGTVCSEENTQQSILVESQNDEITENASQGLTTDSIPQDGVKSKSTLQDDAEVESMSQHDANIDNVSQEITKSENILQDDSKAESTSQKDTKTDTLSQYNAKSENIHQDDAEAEGTSQNNSNTVSLSQDDSKSENILQVVAEIKSTYHNDTKPDTLSQYNAKSENIHQDDAEAESTSQNNSNTVSLSQDDSKSENILQVFAEIESTYHNDTKTDTLSQYNAKSENIHQDDAEAESTSQNNSNTVSLSQEDSKSENILQVVAEIESTYHNDTKTDSVSHFTEEKCISNQNNKTDIKDDLDKSSHSTLATSSSSDISIVCDVSKNIDYPSPTKDRISKFTSENDSEEIDVVNISNDSESGAGITKNECASDSADVIKDLPTVAKNKNIPEPLKDKEICQQSIERSPLKSLSKVLPSEHIPYFCKNKDYVSFSDISLRNKDRNIAVNSGLKNPNPISNFSLAATAEIFCEYRNGILYGDKTGTFSKDETSSYKHELSDFVKSPSLSSDGSDEEFDSQLCSSAEEDPLMDETEKVSDECSDKASVEITDPSVLLGNNEDYPGSKSQEDDNNDSCLPNENESVKDSISDKKESNEKLLPRQSLRLRNKAEVKSKVNSDENLEAEESFEKESKSVTELADDESCKISSPKSDNFTCDDSIPPSTSSNKSVSDISETSDKKPSSQKSVSRKSVSVSKSKSKVRAKNFISPPKGYSLRYRKSRQHIDDSSNLGIDLTKLQLDSPSCSKNTRSKSTKDVKFAKLLSSEIDSMKNSDSDDETLSSKRETRSSTAKIEQDASQNYPGYNLRTRKSIIAPGRLKI